MASGAPPRLRLPGLCAAQDLSGGPVHQLLGALHLDSHRTPDTGLSPLPFLSWLLPPQPPGGLFQILEESLP